MNGGSERRLTRARVWRRTRAWRTPGAATGAAAVVLTIGITGAVTAAPASASVSSKPRDVTIKFAGIGLDGEPVPMANNQAALWPLSATSNNTGPIYGGADGVYHVLPGNYLAGGYVPVGNGQDQNSVVVQRVTISKSGTVTLDSRGAKPFSVGLTGVSSTEQGQFVDLCVTGGPGKQSWATSFLPSYVTPGGTQYVKAFADKNLALVYHGFFTDGSGVNYDVAGVHAGGLPASAAYTAKATDLARLTIAAGAGTVTGSQWAALLDWQYGTANCGADLMPNINDRALPGQVTQYVSPGLLNVGALPSGLPSESSFNTDVRAAAGRSYTETFFNAVAGPNTGTPTIYNGLLCSMPGTIYGDPVATGWAVDAAGSVTLRRGSQSLGRRGFGGFTACFRVNHKTGWYTMTESAHHARPPAAVTPATLSTSIDVTWHLRIPALSSLQYANDVQLPATVTTFDPAGLSRSNQAAPGSTRIVMHVIRTGGYGADMALRYGLHSVRVQYSTDGGHRWQTASVAARRGYWVVTVPSTGSAVSLRSTVTDVKGNSSVETIYNAYGVS
jgi:hypothetical protein